MRRTTPEAPAGLSPRSDDPAVRVLVVDHDELMRMLSVTLLDNDARFVVVAQAGDVEDAFSQVGAVPVDVVVLDHDLPDGRVHDVIAAVRAYQPAAAMVLLTSHPDAAARSNALGLDGALHKRDAAASLVDEVARVAAGGAR